MAELTDRQKLAILATFSHETSMGAYSGLEAEEKATAALRQVGLLSFDALFALSATGAEDAEPAAFIHYRRTGFGTLREAVLTPTGQLLPDVTPLYARTQSNGAAGGGEVSHG